MARAFHSGLFLPIGKVIVRNSGQEDAGSFGVDFKVQKEKPDPFLTKLYLYSAFAYNDPYAKGYNHSEEPNTGNTN